MVARCRLCACLGFLALIAGAFAAQSALSQEAKADAATTAAQETHPNTVTADSDLATVLSEGEKEYLKNCRTCHGTKGTAGVPLAGNEKVSGGFDYLAWAIITGPGYMPEFAEVLSDDQIAQISTYILNSWGNSYGIVTAEDINAIR